MLPVSDVVRIVHDWRLPAPPIVAVYSNLPTVELFLNGNSLGKKKMAWAELQLTLLVRVTLQVLVVILYLLVHQMCHLLVLCLLLYLMIRLQHLQFVVLNH